MPGNEMLVHMQANSKHIYMYVYSSKHKDKQLSMYYTTNKYNVI